MWAQKYLMWARFFIDAIKVSQRQISFAFNLGQFYALIAGRPVYESGPLQIAVLLLFNVFFFKEHITSTAIVCAVMGLLIFILQLRSGPG